MVTHLPILIRPLDEPDVGYLERALVNSIHVPAVTGNAGSHAVPDATRSTAVTSDPVLRRALDAWGREGDLAMVAEAGRGSARRLVGAAWLRRYTRDEPLYGYVDDATPALVVSVEPGFRGFGIGSDLLRALFDAARESGVEQVSLSVDPRNPARRLYERLGFREVDAPRLIEGDANPVLVLALPV